MDVPAHDMGVDFSGFYIGVPEKLLQDADVHTRNGKDEQNSRRYQ